MREALRAAGFYLVEWDEQADIRVVNTCTVTARSDRTCRHEIHAARRRDPDCLLAVTGCLAQVAADAVAKMPEVDMVIGNPDKYRLAEHLATAPGKQAARSTMIVSPFSAESDFESQFFTHFHGQTRAFLKIQTGCDSRCAYCIVPLARGPARSMSKDAVLEQVRILTSHGYREIVLTGVDLGSWGRDKAEGSLAELLESLLHHQSGRGRHDDAPRSVRFRLSSLEPLEVDETLLDVIRDSGDKVARHLHLPLQSGADSILCQMGRPYSSEKYLEVVDCVARRLPDVALGADVIVGFPGETNEQFQETVSLIEASPLTYLHVFAYSDRPGTRAATMEPKIPPQIIRERSQCLRDLGVRKKAAFYDRLSGSEQRALVLAEQSTDGRSVGLTGNYMEVLVDGDEDMPNRFVRVQLEETLPDGRWDATLLQKEE
jgi:threonylcarbamoyladenosine tRNA methylthiotransferase MtaB